MAPRRKFAHIDHDIPRLSEHMYWPSSLIARQHRNPVQLHLLQHWGRQMGIGKAPRTMFHQPGKAGYNDPVTITCVLDLILRSETDTYVEAGPLTDRLQDLYGHLVQFDSTTVGKILSTLAQEQRDVDRPNKDANILDYVTAGGARKYVVMEDVQGWLWLMGVREYFGRLAAERLEALRRGAKPRRLDDIWYGVSEIPWGVPPRDTKHT